MDRKWLPGCAVTGLLCLLAVTACRDGRSNAGRGSTLIIASEQEEQEVFYGQTRSLVFLTLLKDDGNGEIGGNLARSWTHSLDGRDWTFHLRNDVQWHDGVPVTARDLVFTFDLLSDAAVTEA
jgi:ABC-type transport system substrate-binding protein